MGLDAGDFHQGMFDLAGEEIDPFDDDHVVEAAGDRFDTDVASAAGTANTSVKSVKFFRGGALEEFTANVAYNSSTGTYTYDPADVNQGAGLYVIV